MSASLINNVAGQVKFEQLTGMLEKITHQKGTNNKKDLLSRFFEKWRSHHNKLHLNNPDSSDSIYPAMRLLLPQLEKDRDAYGLKEHKLAKEYINTLGLGGTAAEKLKNYRAPANKKGVDDATGDFAAVAYTVLKTRLPEKGDLSIAEVNEQLDKIAEANTNRQNEETNKSFTFLLKNTTPMQHKWLIRMILKDLKIGMSQKSVFSAYHQDADELYNVKMSVKDVCEMLRDPEKRLHEIEVALFDAFRPMLADRSMPNSILETLKCPSFYIETKFDGERILLHMDKINDEYKFFSRNGNDFSGNFGKSSSDGTLAPYLLDSWANDIETIILDGEMLCYDTSLSILLSKSDKYDVKSLNDNGNIVPCLMVFDILYLNGKVLTNLPLEERFKYFDKSFKEIEGRIMKSKFKIGTTTNDCIKALNDAIDDQREGIMVKAPNSAYKPNARKEGWFKLKPDYVGGLMDELDVLVVGGNYGSGHRSGKISHFLCAVADASDNRCVNEKTIFHSFCRVGTGYSNAELIEFNRKLEQHFKDTSKGVPKWLELASGNKQKPDCIVDPTKSFIVQIKAAEIVTSDQYRTGCTLRFPRVVTIRDDKTWKDCMTTEELKTLQEQGKLYGKKHLEEDGEDMPEKKKRREIKSRIIKPSVAAHLRGVNIDAIEKLDKLFVGREICVLNSSKEFTKNKLETDIVAHGGSIVQHPGDETWCCLADKETVKVNNVIASKRYDVVRTSWLIRCLQDSKIYNWSPADMLFTKPETKFSLSLHFDEYGDSYTTDLTNVDQLKTIFNTIEIKKSLNNEDIAEIEHEYFPDYKYGLFRLCVIYPKCKSIPYLNALLTFYGAKIASDLNDYVTHIIVDNYEESKQFKLTNHARSKKFHIVSIDWILDSIKRNNLMQEKDYVLTV